MLLAEDDAQGMARLSCRVTDLGAFESTYKGQLCLDFEVAMPCVYGRESLVTPRLGLCTPATLAMTFLAQSERLSWRQDAESRHFAQWLQSGPVGLELRLAVIGEQADAWAVVGCRRELSVQPQTLVIAANDVDYYYGGDMPVLDW